MKEFQYVAVCARNTDCLRRLALRGRILADRTGRMLKVMLFPENQRRQEEQARILEDTFACAKAVDAEMNVFYTDCPAEQLMKDGADCIIISGGEEMSGQLREMIPGERLLVME